MVNWAFGEGCISGLGKSGSGVEDLGWVRWVVCLCYLGV